MNPLISDNASKFQQSIGVLEIRFTNQTLKYFITFIILFTLFFQYHASENEEGNSNNGPEPLLLIDEGPNTLGAPFIDFKNPERFSVGGDFTQLIWRSTKKIGCGISYKAKTKEVIILCLLSPKVNIEGKFNENIPDKAQKLAEKRKDEMFSYMDKNSVASMFDILKLRKENKPLSLRTSGSENFEYEELG
uniref:SCP domain-containing protein n=1 Tax=Strongyloides venezuelensis TaxID=75913 RepID=A0A0K0FJ78_STRVS